MFMDINDVLSQKPYGVIYLLTCKVNGKVYVGQTTNFWDRMDNYKKLRCKQQRKIYNAIKKHGWENFSYEILDMTINAEILTFLEDFYMETIGSRQDEVGYNIQEAGIHGKHSKETKQIMSNSHKGNKSNTGRKLTEEHKKNIGKGSKGRKHTEETKEHLRKVNIGRKHTEETKKLISKNKKGNTCHKGKKHSEETILRLKESWRKRKLLGVIVSEETRKKRSDSLKGNTNSKGFKHSTETRKRMSEAHIKRHKERKLKEEQLST